MSRTMAIALGTAIIVVGLVVLAFGGQSEQTNHFGLLGLVFTLGGVVRLMTAFSMDSPTNRRGPRVFVDPSDPRWLGGSGGVQLAGKKCAECGHRIVSAREAVACDVCESPAHLSCVKQHKAIAHRPESVGPFR